MIQDVDEEVAGEQANQGFQHPTGGREEGESCEREVDEDVTIARKIEDDGCQARLGLRQRQVPRSDDPRPQVVRQNDCEETLHDEREHEAGWKVVVEEGASEDLHHRVAPEHGSDVWQVLDKDSVVGPDTSNNHADVGGVEDDGDVNNRVHEHRECIEEEVASLNVILGSEADALRNPGANKVHQLVANDNEHAKRRLCPERRRRAERPVGRGLIPSKGGVEDESPEHDGEQHGSNALDHVEDDAAVGDADVFPQHRRGLPLLDHTAEAVLAAIQGRLRAREGLQSAVAVLLAGEDRDAGVRCLQLGEQGQSCFLVGLVIVDGRALAKRGSGPGAGEGAEEDVVDHVEQGLAHAEQPLQELSIPRGVVLREEGRGLVVGVVLAPPYISFQQREHVVGPLSEVPAEGDADQLPGRDLPDVALNFGLHTTARLRRQAIEKHSIVHHRAGVAIDLLHTLILANREDQTAQCRERVEGNGEAELANSDPVADTAAPADSLAHFLLVFDQVRAHHQQFPAQMPGEQQPADNDEDDPGEDGHLEPEKQQQPRAANRGGAVLWHGRQVRSERIPDIRDAVDVVQRCLPAHTECGLETLGVNDGPAHQADVPDQKGEEQDSDNDKDRNPCSLHPAFTLAVNQCVADGADFARVLLGLAVLARWNVAPPADLLLCIRHVGCAATLILGDAAPVAAQRVDRRQKRTSAFATVVAGRERGDTTSQFSARRLGLPRSPSSGSSNGYVRQRAREAVGDAFHSFLVSDRALEQHM
mmetsp:Transcript_52461/g.170373  ORF Transcript_52461/g.170373 Transcript_52461/m.170373 type:complete len:761 (+) Transcript_52461:654-2936(+)